MPLYLRRIEPTSVGRKLVLPENVEVDPLMDSHEQACNRMLVNIIRQLSSLSHHSKTVFGPLTVEGDLLVQRIGCLTKRVETIQKKVEDTEKNPSFLSEFGANRPDDLINHIQFSGKEEAWHSAVTLENNFFSAQSRPKAVEDLYKQCEPIPRLCDLQHFRDDAKDCIKFYSDPKMFFEVWSQQKFEEFTKEKMERQRNRKTRKEGSKIGRRNIKIRKIEIRAEEIRRKEALAGNITINDPPKDLESSNQVPDYETEHIYESVDAADGKIAKKSKKSMKKRSIRISEPIAIDMGLKQNAIPISEMEASNRESLFFPPPPEELLNEDLPTPSLDFVDLPPPPPGLDDDSFEENEPIAIPTVQSLGISDPAPPPPPPPPPPPSAPLNSNLNTPMAPPLPNGSSLRLPPSNKEKSGSCQSLLLQQIQEGKQLKKVKIDEAKEKKDPQRAPQTVGEILALVIDQRFEAFHASDESDSEFGDADSLFEENDFD
eukprot:TCALIF_07402-PA protein Name:"Similar to Wasf3 Wiskott-Aldrich syndrome protein family member 3 (Mus musculus)" AED:0.21 eAED:0.21 QI:123/0.8/1/1/0.4/0.5/6/27/487